MYFNQILDTFTSECNDLLTKRLKDIGVSPSVKVDIIRENKRQIDILTKSLNTNIGYKSLASDIKTYGMESLKKSINDAKKAHLVAYEEYLYSSF